MRRPRRAITNFRGVDHEMNVTVCRMALVRRQVAGEFDSMEGLADAIGRSRSTVSRFFAGRRTSLPVALAVLDKLKGAAPFEGRAVGDIGGGAVSDHEMSIEHQELGSGG